MHLRSSFTRRHQGVLLLTQRWQRWPLAGPGGHQAAQVLHLWGHHEHSIKVGCSTPGYWWQHTWLLVARRIMIHESPHMYDAYRGIYAQGMLCEAKQHAAASKTGILICLHRASQTIKGHVGFTQLLNTIWLHHAVQDGEHLHSR